MDLRDAKTIITVNTTVETGCPFCGEWTGGELKFDESVQHLIQKHGCTLLHVGSQTTRDGNGGPWHSTVAVLGSEEVAAKRTPVGSVKFQPKEPPKSFAELGKDLG
ncbi:MAG: hypothetical protein ACTHOH_00030 [Lysobacteraceae bacterium]